MALTPLIHKLAEDFALILLPLSYPDCFCILALLSSITALLGQAPTQYNKI